MDTIIIFFAKYLHLFIIAGAFLFGVLSEPKKRKQLILLALIALPISYGLGEVAGLLIQSPRPFVVEGIAPLIPHAPTNGFPSTHALMSMTIAGIVFVYNKKAGSALVVMALLVGFSRVLAQVHNPIDILGGIFIAIFGTLIGMRILHVLFLTIEKYVSRFD